MSPIVTYSPAYTIVPTYECFNRCAYCNFRVDPGGDRWLTLETAEQILCSLRSQGVIEILVLSGEVHPHSDRRQAWFDRIFDLCELALSLGFLPHTNAGPLSFAEMAQLKTVNVSMGLMLEQLAALAVHRHAPSKQADLRMQQLEWAGELRIPFTTGLLLGIGERESDWQATLEAIAQTHDRWGHIQEVILQPHCPGKQPTPGNQQSWTGEAFESDRLVEVVAIARRLLPDSIALQIPPNLVSEATLLACLREGATDIGGISPKDEVNPDYPHPHDRQLADLLERSGYQLRPRLPVYPQYDNWLSTRLQQAIGVWREKITGDRGLPSSLYG